MKQLLLSLVIIFCCIDDVVAETYQQCKTRVIANIARYEAETGKTVSKDNKRLAVQAYCQQKRVNSGRVKR